MSCQLATLEERTNRIGPHWRAARVRLKAWPWPESFRGCVATPSGREELESEIGGRGVGLSRWERRTRSASEGQLTIIKHYLQLSDWDGSSL